MCVHACMPVFVHVCVHACLRVCVCVHMCVCIHTCVQVLAEPVIKRRRGAGWVLHLYRHIGS